MQSHHNGKSTGYTARPECAHDAYREHRHEHQLAESDFATLRGSGTGRARLALRVGATGTGAAFPRPPGPLPARKRTHHWPGRSDGPARHAAGGRGAPRHRRSAVPESLLSGRCVLAGAAPPPAVAGAACAQARRSVSSRAAPASSQLASTRVGMSAASPSARRVFANGTKHTMSRKKTPSAAPER